MRRLAVLFILFTTAVSSQSYYMNIRLKGGATTSFPIQDVQKITFANITAVGNDKAEKLLAVIKTFNLLQNYPNPFNPNTSIRYEIPKSGNVEISIFNVNGQLVRTVEKGFQTTGTHTAVWDGRSNPGQTAASGVYFCRVIFENSTLVKRMLFLK